MTRTDSIEKYNQVLQKKMDKLDIFLTLYPQYKDYFTVTQQPKSISGEKNGKNSNEKDGK